MATFDSLANPIDRKLCIHVRRVHHLAFDPYELTALQQSRGPQAATAACLALITLLACRPDPEPVPTHPHIGKAEARRLVLEKYRALFTRKYFRIDDEYHEFAPLSEADFKHVVFKGDAWEVRCEPLVGHYVTGRVAATGDWVELNQVGFANE